MAYIINETVELMGKIALEGNIIPNEWFVHLRNDKGKIQTNAVLILADIVHWFLPTSIFDIAVGRLIGHTKKFKDDLPNLDYDYFKNKFGFTEKQTRPALLFLEEKGLIFREFRKNRISKDVFNNVMHIGIHPKKIAEISRLSDGPPLPPCPKIEPSLQSLENKKIESPSKQKTQKKDWAAKYSDEQKAFLEYLLNIKPEVGDPIERDHATWWIKEFGIEKIKTALQVYWQQVQKAKLDSTIPMPLHIGKYVRKALNDGTLPIQHKQEFHCVVTNLESSLQKKKQGKLNSLQTIPFTSIKEGSGAAVTNLEPCFQKRKLYMSYMNIHEVNEINDKSVTFQKKEIQTISQKDTKKEEAARRNSNELNPNCQTPQQKKASSSDWKALFTVEERKFLTFLLSIVPAKGKSIEEKHATWWIKHFGIAKIEVALQVYWQQVDKAKKNSKIPMPASIGAYVREALNKGLQPISEVDQKNKAFAEEFKKQTNLGSLTITEKYCRFEEVSKEWYYNMPEVLFQESLRSAFKNYYSQYERPSCEAFNDGIEFIQEKFEKSEYGKIDDKSVAFQKELQVVSKEEFKKEEAAKRLSKKPTPSRQISHQKKDLPSDGKISFTLEERKFLAFLLNIIPAKGESIGEQHATEWIKHFGIAKVKVALQVYWQQVEKAKQDSQAPLPENLVNSVREALNKGIQPCREGEHRNKAFAEQFKAQVGWSELTIIEKCCRVENIGKEWYYNLPEAIFIETLKSTFENYYNYTERQYSVA